MPKIIKLALAVIFLFLFKPKLVQANYTFNETFDTNSFTSWLTIPEHTTPNIISSSERTYAKYYQTGNNSYSYLGNKSETENVISINFDYYYESADTSQGAGFMLTNKVPITSQNPPNDNGDYSVGIWPINGDFYLLSPMCDNSTLCNLSINSRAIFKLDRGLWNSINIRYFTDHVVIKLNFDEVSLFYGNVPLPNGFFLGNPVLATNSQAWTEFNVDSLFIEYGNPKMPVLPAFPYLAQNSPFWGYKEYDSAMSWAMPGHIGIERWGCALTSVAMILQKYHVKTIDGELVNPDNLNTWLKAQTDGYIGQGLLNWLAVTRYVRESYVAEKSPIKLEYERSYPPTIPILPAIIGVDGHFVVAYEHGPTGLTINDPADQSETILTSPIRSINRFISSQTDLSYLMFVINPGYTLNLTNEFDMPIQIDWSDEYLTDDVSGGYGELVRIGLVAKPLNGKYKLVANQPEIIQNILKVYLYDNTAQTTPQTFTLTKPNTSFDLNYSKEPENPRTIILTDTDAPRSLSAPLLLSPLNYVHVNTRGLVLDWSDVNDPSGPVTYNYKSSWPGGSYGPVSTGVNSYINADGTPDQTYEWQVQACNSLNICSEWATPSVVIVDSTPPSADIVFPVPGPSSNYFDIIFSENINLGDAINGANYFLFNWPGAGGSGDLVGDALITYNSESKTTKVTFTNPGWYISPEQLWGIQNIHDLAGNIIEVNPYTEYSTPMTAPVLLSAPIVTSNPTNTFIQSWSWQNGSDIGSGIKGYSTRTYDVINQQYLSDWLWIGQVLGASTEFSEGNWQLSLRATDNAGNNSEALNSNNLIVNNIDITPPSMPINLHFDNPSLPCGGFTNQKFITFDWDDASDNKEVLGYEYSVDYPLGTQRGLWTTFFRSSSYSGSLNEGIHYLKLRTKDTSDNYSEWGDTCSITYDSLKPEFKTKTSFSGWYNKSQTSYFDFTDDNLIDSYVTPSCDINSEGVLQTCNSTNSVCDKAGNCFNSSLTSNSANIDFTKPTITLNTWGKTLEGSTNDSLSGVEKIEIKIIKPGDSGILVTPIGISTWTYTMNDAPSGDYIVVIVAYDYAGNVSNEIRKEYNIGTTVSRTNDNNQSGVLGTSVDSQFFKSKSALGTKYKFNKDDNVSSSTNDIEIYSKPTKNVVEEVEKGRVLGVATTSPKSKTIYWWAVLPLAAISILFVSKLLKSKGHRV